MVDRRWMPEFQLIFFDACGAMPAYVIKDFHSSVQDEFIKRRLSHINNRSVNPVRSFLNSRSRRYAAPLIKTKTFN